ncbi:hypothetical protein JYT17_00470 [Nitrospira defluvii]|nr:hypothetical protein [Nitrospira defluvii]
MRLFIEVTSEQHNKLKAVAALNGQTIKDYVLDRVLPDTEAAALDQLEDFLKPRIEAAERGEFSTRSTRMGSKNGVRSLKLT